MADSSVGAESDLTTETVDYGSIQTQLASTDLSRHLALFYRTPDEQLAVAAAFIDRGLRDGERCLYVADEHDIDTIAEYFRDRGIDVDRHTTNGRLEIRDATEVYGGDVFDPEATVDALEEYVEESVDAGYDGFRIAGENTWSFHVEEAVDSLFEFEVGFDDCCPDIPIAALCQYNVRRFSDRAIAKTLQSHEHVIYRGTVSRNPYYVPPEETLESGAPKSTVELLLEQTRDIAEFRRDIETREQRLSVVNRVLRHNLRNELNVVLGRLEWIEDRQLVAEDGREHLESAERAVERLLELSEHARHLNRTLDDAGTDQAPLLVVVDDALAEVQAERGRTPDVETALFEAVTVNAAIEPALRELFALVLAATDDDSEQPTVRLAAERGSGVATITVRGPSPLIPIPSRFAIDASFEDALEHTLGLRMWVVRWTVESLNGRIEWTDHGDECTVTVTAPIVDTEPS